MAYRLLANKNFARYFIISIWVYLFIPYLLAIWSSQEVKRVINNERVRLDNNELKINVTKKNGCYLEILQAANDQLNNMLSYHSRVLVIRFDLHMINYTADNKTISMFVRKLRKRLKQRYKVINMGFIWVREMERAKRQHYHFALIINANLIIYPAKVLKLIGEIWEHYGNPQPYTPTNCYKVIKRDNINEFREVFYRLSYMAKARGKGYKSKTANDYSSSRIKPKP